MTYTAHTGPNPLGGAATARPPSTGRPNLRLIQGGKKPPSPGIRGPGMGGWLGIFFWLLTDEAGDGTLQGSMSPAFFNAPGHADAVLSRAMETKRRADAQGSTLSEPCSKRWYKSNFKTEQDAIDHHYDKHGYPAGISEQDFVDISSEWAMDVWRNRQHYQSLGQWKSWPLMDHTRGVKVYTPSDPDIYEGIIKVYPDGALPVTTFWR